MPGETPAFPGERPNILLVSIDSLRADHLGCYGYERDTSPVIDRLAAEGVVFETMLSSTSWTLPAHASMFTGLPDIVHGANRTASPLALARETLAERLRDAGYETAGFWSGPYLAPHFGLDQGFQHYESCTGYDIDDPVELMHEREGAPEHAGRAHARAHDDVTSPRIVERVARFLDEREGREGSAQPLFLFVHMWDVHYDFIPPPPYDTRFGPAYDGPVDGRNLGPLLRGEAKLSGADRERLLALYDGEIAWTDHHVGLLLEELGPALEDTLVVITGDHGEEFWEHGQFGHRKALYEESVRVPLILRFPGRLEPQRTSRQARMVDLLPTLLHAAGAPPYIATDGCSLIEILRREVEPAEEERAAILELSGPTGGVVALRTPRFKILYALGADEASRGVVGLWNLKRDPGEVRNLADRPRRPPLYDEAFSMLQTKQRMVRELQEYHGTDPAAVDLPASIEEQLRGVGYVGEDGRDLAPVIPATGDPKAGD